MGNYPIEWVFAPFLLEINVRLSIFSIIGVSAGLPALVWSVNELIEHKKNGHSISVFIILLLLTDFSELLLSPYILIKLFLDDITWNMDWTCRVFWSLCWSSRVCGLVLNQLVALEGLLSVRYPLYTAAVFSSPCFRIFHTLVFLSVIICWICLPLLSFAFVVIFLFIMSVVTWAIYHRASRSAERPSHTSRKPDQHMWVIFVLTQLVLYLPFFSGIILLLSFYWHVVMNFFYIPWLLTSVRLISDPLLCVLVCRQKLRLQTSRNPAENVVQSE